MSTIRHVARGVRSHPTRTGVRVALGLAAAALVAAAAVRALRDPEKTEVSRSHDRAGAETSARALPSVTRARGPLDSSPPASSAVPKAPESSASVAPAAPKTTNSSLARDQLELERRLLDGARAALAQGAGSRALELTREHEQSYRRGILAQEREALVVRALLSLGRLDEARARTARFRRNYPDSVLGPTLESMLDAAGSR